MDPLGSGGMGEGGAGERDGRGEKEEFSLWLCFPSHRLLKAVMMEMEDEQLEEEEEVAEQKGGLKYDEAAAVAELQAKMAEPMTRPRKK